MEHDFEIRGFKYEADCWYRYLDFIQQETVHFKNRLVEILNEDVDGSLLVHAEEFHEEFLAQEQMIRFLMADTIRQCKLLEEQEYDSEKKFNEILKNQNRLRKDIHKAEQLFNSLKGAFESYQFAEKV